MTTDKVEILVESTADWPKFRGINIDGQALQVVAMSATYSPWNDDSWSWVARLGVALSDFCQDGRQCVIYAETPAMKPFNRLERLRMEQYDLWGTLRSEGVEVLDESSVSVRWGTEDAFGHFGCAILSRAGDLLRAVRADWIVGTITAATGDLPDFATFAQEGEGHRRSTSDLFDEIARERAGHGDIMVYPFGVEDDREYGFVFYGPSTEIALLKAALSDFEANSLEA